MNCALLFNSFVVSIWCKKKNENRTVGIITFFTCDVLIADQGELWESEGVHRVSDVQDAGQPGKYM